MPVALEISFSGIRPTDRSKVSHSYSISVPGIAFLFSSTLAIITFSTLSLPIISTTV